MNLLHYNVLLNFYIIQFEAIEKMPLKYQRHFTKLYLVKYPDYN
jgi:hypothetical protein